MAITPNSTIYFCNVPWDSSYSHVCDAANMPGFLTGSALIKTVSDYSYIRKDSVINVSVAMDDLIGANYVMYKNANHENKWFYAFIDKMEYKSDLATAVTIRTDVYQTWRDSITVPACFVQREHVNVDTLGLHTVPEGLDTGELKKDVLANWWDFSTLAYIVAVTKTPAGAAATGFEYNGVFSGVAFYTFFGSSGIGSMKSFLEEAEYQARPEGVVAIFAVPSNMLPSGAVNGALLGGTGLIAGVDSTSVAFTRTTVDGYTPKNNKLFTFPYYYLHVTNLQGNSADYAFELFADQTSPLDFYAEGTINPNSKVLIMPGNGYKMIAADSTITNYEEALTISGFPLCVWASDAYAQWLAQSGTTTAVTVAGGVGSVAGGIATANPVLVAGGLGAVLSQIAEVTKQAAQPAHVHSSIPATDVLLAHYHMGVIFYCMTIRAEMAKIIDDYFTKYGYKIAQVKAPNLTGRAYWNYVKTIDCIVKGGIPEQDKQQLQKMFDNGVTIWHSFANLGDYSLTNAIS